MTGFLEVAGERLYYSREDAPGKPLVVFVHGLGGKAEYGEAYAALPNRRYGVLALDLTGRGNSTGNRPVSADLWVNDLKAALPALGVKECYLLAHSFGGVLAAKLAAWPGVRVLGALLVVPYNPFVPVFPGGIRQKCADLYPRPVDKATDAKTLQEYWAKADKGLAHQFETYSERAFAFDRDIMVDFRDQAFHDGYLLDAYGATSNYEIIAADNDDVVPSESLRELAKLKGKTLRELPGAHDVIVTQKAVISAMLDEMVSSRNAAR